MILPLAGPGWSFERLDAAPETTRQFFSDVLPDLLALDDALCAEDAQREGVVSQFVRNPVGNFVSSSLTPMHFKDKLVVIGDAGHTMSGFWGQGMNMYALTNYKRAVVG